MFRHAPYALMLLALCVVIHALAISLMLRWLARTAVGRVHGFWSSTWLLIGIAWRLVAAHLLEVLCWAGYYWWIHAFPDFETSVYFSIVTYTTIGYGDVVPPVWMRVTAGIEGLTGILMCGWSTGFFFATVARLFTSWFGEGKKGHP
jgi:hypothetical protein